MAKQPRFTPTEDNNKVIIGDITIELEVGKAYTKAALVKALAELEEVPLIEDTANELLADFGVVPGDDEASGDGSGKPLPEVSNEERTAPGEMRTVACPKCKARRTAELGTKTKCVRCNHVFEAT